MTVYRLIASYIVYIKFLYVFIVILCKANKRFCVLGD